MTEEEQERQEGEREKVVTIAQAGYGPKQSAVKDISGPDVELSAHKIAILYALCLNMKFRFPWI